MKINRDRLEQHLQNLAQFGQNRDGGIDRCIGSQAELDARKYLKKMWAKMGLHVRTDSIANLWAEAPGIENGLRPIVAGSHHDAVSDGGRYDGALGVLIASEVYESIKDSKKSLRHPYTVVSFTAEEPNPYNISTMGSRSITGKLSVKELLKADDGEGHLLSDAINAAGGDIKNLEEEKLLPGDFAAFLECHIEQGRNLFDSGLSVAVVSKITGIYRELIIVRGEANHAGTTVMKNRHDALLGAAQCALLIETIVKEVDRNDVVATVGKMDVIPNSANIISGECRLIMELRTPDSDMKEMALEKFSEGLIKIQTERGVSFERKIILNQAEVSMDETVKEALREGCGTVQKQEVELVSMAGHDSVHMTGIAPTGMLFVQSINGISHSRYELTEMDDIEKAANAMLKAVLMLDEKL